MLGIFSESDCSPNSVLTLAPASASIAPMTQSPKRPTLDASKISSEALAKIVESHADVVRDVERAIDESPVVVIGMAQNPHVR